MAADKFKSGTNGEGISIERLRADLKGRVIAPSDPDYDQARVIFYGGFDRRPAVIIRPADAADVAYVVRLARETGMELAVRSGGHSTAGHSVSEGGIVLDLRDMKKLDIDVENRTAWAEAGLTAGEYTAAAAEHGLATGFSDTGSVGIGGITLGGGIGFLSRKYGLTIDDLLAAEIVTADGELLRVDAENHPDLFWALRGGGGNFGVVTRFKFRLHEVDHVYGGMLILPATPEVIVGFIEAAQAAPDELTTIANIMVAPPAPFVPPPAVGKLVLFLLAVYAGDAQAGEKAFAPFRALAEPIFDMLKPMRYHEMYVEEGEEGGFHPTAVGHNMYLKQVDRDTAATMIEYIQNSDAPMRVIQLRVLGGAIARVPVEATAYAHRQAPIMANLAAFYTSPEEKQVREKWLADFAAALDQGLPGAYVNFLNDEGEERVRAAYPAATWERLAAVKARYDPTNLFRLNQNIPPVVGEPRSEVGVTH